MLVIGVGLTDTGRVRERNEDAFFLDNELGLYIVCDGMGGHAKGEVASSMSVDTVVGWINEQRPLLERVRRGDEPEGALVRIAREAVETACREVYAAATTRPGFAGMGTTLTLLLFGSRKAVMAHVGDTRLYVLRDHALHQLSADHTMVADLITAGTLTAEQAHESVFAQVLTRAIGTQRSVQVDTLLIDVLPGDRFLLCSDGVTEHVPDVDDLAGCLSGDFEGVPEQLIDLANGRGGKDNSTVLVVRAEAAEPVPPATVEFSPGVDIALDVLGSAFLFEGLALGQLQRVLNACEVDSHDTRQTILEEGQPGDRMILILDGRASLMRSDRSVGELGAGDCVGEGFLVHERPCRATLVAREPTRILTLTRERFQTLANRRPWLGVELLGRLGKRMGEDLRRAYALVEPSATDSSTTLRPAQRL